MYVRPSVINVPGLVVTASRSRERPDESPVSVSVLESQELQQRNVNHVGEALPFAQGVVSNGGQLDIRGASGISRGVGSRVLVLLDGHRMLKGVGSEADFEKLPLLDVERVEVVKGSHSSLYGTGALGGVVNVITAVPSETPETLVRGYIGTYDTPSRYRFTDETLSTAGVGVQHSRRIAGVGTTLFLGTDGSEGFRQNGGFSRWQARVKTVFGPDTQRPVDAFVNWTQRDADEFYTWLSEDQPLEVEPEELGDWLRETDLSVGATLRPLMTQKSSLQIRPIFDYNSVQNHFHDSDDSHRSSRLAADAQFDIAPSFGQAVTAGVEASWTEITSSILVVDPSILDLGLYAQDEIRVSDRFRAVAGLRFDYHGATSAESDFVVSPRLGGSLPSVRDSESESIGQRRIPGAQRGGAVYRDNAVRIRRHPEPGTDGRAGVVGRDRDDGAGRGLAAPGRCRVLQRFLRISLSRHPWPVSSSHSNFRTCRRPGCLDSTPARKSACSGDQLGFKINYLYLNSRDERTGESLPYRSPHNVLR